MLVAMALLTQFPALAIELLRLIKGVAHLAHPGSFSRVDMGDSGNELIQMLRVLFLRYGPRFLGVDH